MTDNPYPQPAAADIRLTDILHALSDPGRVKMVQVLADGGYHACNVDEFGLDITKSTLSHHFKTLREAGLTTIKVNGRNMWIALREEELEDRFPGLIAGVTSAEARNDLQKGADYGTADAEAGAPAAAEAEASDAAAAASEGGAATEAGTGSAR